MLGYVPSSPTKPEMGRSVFLWFLGMNYITGASGFLGSHLTKRLDDFTAIPHDQIQSFDYKPFDNFYFLSSYGNLASQSEEDEIYKANIEDLLHVLYQVKDYKFKSFVYISSSSVKLKVQTTYSRTKRAAEEILLSFMERHKLPICIVRPYSITGVGEQEEHLIPKLIKSALYGEEVNFVGAPTHDFIDVEDVVDGILNLSSHRAKGIYELGTGQRYSNHDVLALVEIITGKRAKINPVDSLRPYDTDNWVSSNFRARSFGWLPKKTLQQSIKEMVSYEKN